MCEMQSTELLEPNVPVYLKLVTSAAQRQIHAGENLRLRLAGFTAQGAFGIAFKYIRA